MDVCCVFGVCGVCGRGENGLCMMVWWVSFWFFGFGFCGREKGAGGLKEDKERVRYWGGFFLLTGLEVAEGKVEE